MDCSLTVVGGQAAVYSHDAACRGKSGPAYSGNTCFMVADIPSTVSKGKQARPMSSIFVYMSMH